MIRKWLAMLLTVLVAVNISLCALADTQHTFSLVPGEAVLSSENPIVDLMNAIDLRITEGERSGALTVLINGQDLITLGMTADITGVYAQSKLLGSDVLYVTWDDAFAVLADVLKENLAEAKMDTAALQTLESGLAEAKNNIVTAVGNGLAHQTSATMPMAFEESRKLAQEMFRNDPEMLKYLKNVYQKLRIEEGVFAVEGRDAAEQKWSLVMDEADLAAVCDTAYFRTMMMEALAVEYAGISEAELNKVASEMIAEIKRVYQASDFELAMEVYTQDAGFTPVGADVRMTLNVAEGETVTDAQLAAKFDRLTDAEGVYYRAEGSIAAEGEAVELYADLYRAYSEKSKGMFGLLADGEEFVITYEAENVAADTRVRTAQLYMRSGATAILEPAASQRPVYGLQMISEKAEGEVLEKLEKANAENSINVMKLSEAEMQKLRNTIAANGTQVVYMALGQLPTSTLSLLIKLIQ